MQLSDHAIKLEVTATSEEGISASVTLPGPFGVANKPEQALDTLRDLLGQLGTTEYHATRIELDAPQAFFIPNSQLKALRREAIEAVTEARETMRPLGSRKAVSVPPPVFASDTRWPLFRFTPMVDPSLLPGGPGHAPTVGVVQRALAAADVPDLAAHLEDAVDGLEERDRAHRRGGVVLVEADLDLRPGRREQGDDAVGGGPARDTLVDERVDQDAADLGDPAEVDEEVLPRGVGARAVVAVEPRAAARSSSG